MRILGLLVCWLSCWSGGFSELIRGPHTGYLSVPSSDDDNYYSSSHDYNRPQDYNSEFDAVPGRSEESYETESSEEKPNMEYHSSYEQNEAGSMNFESMFSGRQYMENGGFQQMGEILQVDQNQNSDYENNGFQEMPYNQIDEMENTSEKNFARLNDFNGPSNNYAYVNQNNNPATQYSNQNGFNPNDVDLTTSSLRNSFRLGAGYEHTSMPGDGVPISKHVEITRNVPYPVYKQVHVPVQKPVNVQIPHPVLVPVPHPYPIHIPVAKPVAVQVIKEISIPVEKIVPFPVIKKVPYTVEKHVPYPVEKVVHVHKKVPYPVRVPVLKTVIHKVDPYPHSRPHSHSHQHSIYHQAHGWQ